MFSQPSSGRRARRNTRRKTMAWLAGLAAVAAAAIVPLTADAATDGQDYVALGDSYSAGTGASPYLSNLSTIPPVNGLRIIEPTPFVNHSNTCQRSVDAYPAVFAKEFGGPDGFLGSFTFAACAGAVTGDVVERQVEALNAETDLVSLTIGGNDIQFADAMETCVKNFDITGACQSALNRSLGSMRSQLPATLDRTYRTIHEKAPNARIVVLGYPKLFDEAGTCTVLEKVFNPSATVRKEMNEASVELNQTIHAAVADVGGTAGRKIQFAEIQEFFDGRGICSADPFLTEPVTVGVSALADSYHPNKKGHEAYFSRLGFAVGA
ncbi:SGNH family lipase [Streptomyces pseudoechinosporeus]